MSKSPNYLYAHGSMCFSMTQDKTKFPQSQKCRKYNSVHATFQYFMKSHEKVDKH